MKTIQISSIVIGNRHRKFFDEGSIAELARSIVDRGLIHPIVLRNDNDIWTLVAGERRLRAIKLIHKSGMEFYCDGKVFKNKAPYVLIADTDDIGARETELAENLIREDLSWQERIAALDELHSLRLAQNPEQTDADTARELSGVPLDNAEPAARSVKIVAKRMELARAKIIAPFLDDPVVKAAGSAVKALAIVAAKVEAEFTAELAQRGAMGKTEHALIAGDLREEMPKLPAGTFSCIIADPPYGIDSDKFGDVAQLRHEYVDDNNTAREISMIIAEEAYRLAEDEAHLYLFCDINLFVYLRNKINAETEWKVWRTPIIWNKGTGHAPIQSAGFVRCYELILFASKGGKAFSTAHKDIIECSPEKDKVHAAGKPFRLYAELFKYSCLPGDRVLDPCCGAGTVFSAAIAAGVVATGIEIDSQWLDYARTRQHQEE